MPATLNRFGLAVSALTAAGAVALWQPSASAGQPRPVAEADDPLQVLADVVLIESDCRQFNVDYGRLFAYAERNGIRPVDIMPFGERRAAFDADYRRRARDTQGSRLCGALAQDRDALIPGVFTAR
ncbi:hypothetical protein D3273_05270 [Lichenibacterium minor]|uniref:TIGR02301 family protein n=1 Tax=Lichenibacterium minor TaxID=2316528 RepID=A0A4Q2U834_9HYPH|nr:hypothetical protein [Lichenibacterium minor]RYC32879.1 hypothetical protein D3273_05270 [Lichenibacterium minor]